MEWIDRNKAGNMGEEFRGKELIVIALLSMTLLSVEIIWTRIFSAEYFYNFAFLILSLAFLGLGLGALSLRFFSAYNRWECLGPIMSLTAFLAMAGPVIVLHSNFSFSEIFRNWLTVGQFILIVLLLSSSFFYGGMALTKLLKHYHENMSRLYMADLIGAGSGVLFGVVCMDVAGTPAATFLLCIPLIISAFIVSRGLQKLAPIVLLVLAPPLSFQANKLIHKPRQEHGSVMIQVWNAMSKIKIYGSSEDPVWGINVDNAANSPVYRFDGDWETRREDPFEFGISVRFLMKDMDSCRFMSLGAGGGGDVLQALQEGATDIHAVEVNPEINRMMTVGELAEFSGFIYRDPRVRVITEDARTYVRRHRDTFDIIYSLSANTFAALASGAFSLAENYLFTVEAFEDYYHALSDRGVMMMEHQFYMPRIVSEVLIALGNCGIEHPEEHIAVYALPQMRRQVLLLSKRPMSDEMRQNGIGELTEENIDQRHLLFPAGEGDESNLINRIITQGWLRVQADSPIDLTPSTDNRPFTAQLGRWDRFHWDQLSTFSPFLEFQGFPLSKMLIVIITLIILFLIIPLNIAPWFLAGEKLTFFAWLYFFAIGAGFMIIEVVLIQQYTLIIGPSSYTVIVILFTLLLGAGIGSKMSVSIPDGVAFAGIILWIIADIFLFSTVSAFLSVLTMTPRIIVTILILLPLGFFMGIPFPKGTRRVGSLIDWGVAVNGAAAVLGSTVIILVSFSWGYSAALSLGAACYAIAWIMINSRRPWISPVLDNPGQ